MTRIVLCTTLVPLVLLTIAPVRASERLPNVVLVLADDLGYGDLGCYNPESKIPTPHVDRLAAEGLRFTDAHAPGSVCVPSRYGLLTGRYPFRVDWNNEVLIESGRMTVASLLADRGYATWCVGKWHLGLEGWRRPPADTPLRGGPVDCGFAYYFGLPASLDIPPYYYIEGDRPVALPTLDIEASHTPGVRPIQGAFWRAGRIAPGFCHDEVLPTLADQALALLREHHQGDAAQPFFLYLALTAPHTPWLPAEEFQGRSGAGTYGDFAVQVDALLGRVMDELAKLDFADNTLLLFASDNGALWFPEDIERYGHRSSGPWRGIKGDAWEGGHRVPLVARWPGTVGPGTTCDQTVCFTDLLATLAAIVGTELPHDAGEDSYNLLPLLRGEPLDGPLREATLHQAVTRSVAIRQGPWKLIPQLGSGGFSEPRVQQPGPNDPPGQLYHLDDDPGETVNLYAEHPEVVARLTALLERYREQGFSRPRP